MIHRLPDAQAAADACAEAIAGWLNEGIALRGRATLAVSGGSTPKLMFRRLAGLGLDWSRIHVFWVDERGVEPDDEQSNYRMTLEHLLEPAGVPDANVHRMFGEWDAVDAAMAYSAELKAFFASKMPVFDVVQCGLGDDAHTASLFPGELLIVDRSGIAAGVWVEKKGQWRITLLPGPIVSAQHLCVLVAGGDKAEAVRRVFATDDEWDEVDVPGRLLTAGEWFADEAALTMYEDFR